MAGPLRRVPGPFPGALLVVLVLLLGGVGGCSTWQGARLYESGSEALSRGETERAIRELEEAAVLVPHASEVQNHLGRAYARAGRDGDALRAFRRAVALDRDNQAARRNLRGAEAWLRRGEARSQAPGVAAP